MTQYKVLTLWEPWATLYAHGIKKIETRPKATKWTVEKGVYLIHSAQKWSEDQAKICIQEPFKSELSKLGCLYQYEDFDIGYKGYSFKFNHGQIIGSIEIVECSRIRYNKDTALPLKPHFWSRHTGELKSFYVQEPENSFGDYSDGRFAWISQTPRILKTPIPYKGVQGYYQNFKGDINQLIFK